MATKKSGPAKKGATKGGAGAEVDLSTHPLVAEGNADPDNIEAPPEVVSLVGYIGPSRRDGYIRLYQDLSFRNYYEIPSESVVGTSPVNPDDENSPTHVQVEPDARVEVVTVSVQSVEARYLSGSISSGFLGAAAVGTGAQAAQLCTNITTYMPSCVAQQPPCTNITTYMPSCVRCDPRCIATIVTSGVPGGGGGPCLTVVTANPTDCGRPCDPRCIATVVTSGVPAEAQAAGAAQFAAPAAGGQTYCTNITTYVPSCVACNPNCIATVVTSGVPAGGGAGFAAAAAPQPTPPQFCITLYTATNCGPICLTRVTANPTDCGPKQFEAAAVGAGVNVEAGIAPQFCIFTRYPTACGPICTAYYTARPTHCGPVYCITITYPTRGPICHFGGFPTRIVCDTNFPSCLQEVPGQVGPGPVLAARAAPAAAAAQPYCITLHTAVPTWCEPCRPIATTAATLCTQHITVPDPGTIICPTLYTARPTGCG